MLFVVALLTACDGGSSNATTTAGSRTVPPEVQAQLPLDISLGNRCPGANTLPKLARELQRGAQLMIRELERHPDWLVTYTYYYADEPEVQKQITVRNLRPLR